MPKPSKVVRHAKMRAVPEPTIPKIKIKMNKKRASTKIGKRINKAINKKLRAPEKRRKDVKRLSEKALALNEEMRNTVNEFKRNGVTVVNDDIIPITKKRIEEIAAKKRPSQKDVDLLKEYARVTQYDYIKVEMDITGKEINGLALPERKEVSLRDIRRIIRKQANNPDKLNDKEHQIISQYSAAMMAYKNQQVVDLTTAEQQESFKKKFNRARDAAIGGNSKLINDLSYTYDALYLGRDFVERLQKIMANPNDFVLIEAWYRANTDVQNKIDQAIGKEWYSNFQDFSNVINEAINNMPNLSKEAEDILREFQDAVEVVADEQIERY